jgi:DNA-binding PadR family transcriptional regulator
MYPDHSLMPKEAVHLAALGMLAEGSKSYGELAAQVRDFTSHVMGPNLDLMGTSIQMLCYEGLIAPNTGGSQDRVLAPDAVLTITEAGGAMLKTLLLASVRTPFDDLNKLVVALKMRLFDRLDENDRTTQVALITTALRSELARLDSLRRKRQEESREADALVRWLDHDCSQIQASIDWFESFSADSDC